MDEYVEVTAADYVSPFELDHGHFYPVDRTKLLILEVGDIFDEMEAGIYAAGETPMHNRHDEYTHMFLEEIYNAVGFLPRGDTAAVANIRDVLDTHEMYFGSIPFTPLQKQAWYFLTHSLVERFKAFKLYDYRFENRYDFYALQGDALVLKLFE